MPFEDMEFGSFVDAERKARRAFELYENGSIPQALVELQAALRINPSNSSWHFNKALTLDALNRFEDAISEYEIASELNPDDPEILNSLAVDYTRIGQYDLAISVFEHIQKLDPMFEPCYCNRIITYTEMQQHDLAEQMFYLAQQIDPNCALCYYNIGNSLFIRGQYDKAIRCWLRTAELEPTHPQINYRIAQACCSQGAYDHARRYFLAELRVDPGSVEVILDFGLFLLEVNDIESAKEKFNRILELKPGFPAALFYLGEIAFNNADYERAADLFNKALEQDKTLIGPRYRLAQDALMKGQKQKARNYLVSEVELVPQDANALVSMGSMFLKIGQGPCEQPSRFDRAPLCNFSQSGNSNPDLDYVIYCLLKAVELDSANAQAYYYLGFVSTMQGRFEDAADFFTHALDIKPKDVRTLRASAVVYLAMGRLTNAAERINKALTLAGDDLRLRTLAWRINLARTTRRISGFFHRLRPRFKKKNKKT